MAKKSRKEVLKDAALSYADLGWRVLPLHNPERGKCSCGKKDCNSVGKHPLIRNGVKGATTDKSKIQDWWEKWPEANIGIATGKESGLVVLDVDLHNPHSDGHVTLKDLERKNSKLPDTIESLTGGGGRHIFFRHPGGSSLKSSRPVMAVFKGNVWPVGPI